MSRGIAFLLAAELFFTVATVFSKHVTNTSPISAVEVTFFRFFLGFFVAFALVTRSRQSLVPSRLGLLVWRGVLNTVAVMLFFLASQYTSITNTHMLNMTYPFFIFLFAPLFFKNEKVPVLLYPALAAAIAGVWLVIAPDFQRVSVGDALALASAVVAAFGIITLNLARRNDATAVILFYMMLIGTTLNWLVMIPVFIMPQGIEWVWLLASAAVGVAGQVCITYGYKYITARSGSLVSTSRIFYAVVLGALIFGESLTWRVMAGGVLIAGAIGVVTLLRPPGAVPHGNVTSR